jgi:hypothetical protein
MKQLNLSRSLSLTTSNNMSTKFPINPVEFVHTIQNNAPATYDYLIDEWNLWNASDKEQPEPDDILTILENYSGNNHDTHWWA